MEDRVRDIRNLHDKMVSKRRFYEPMWQEISERMGNDAGFTVKYTEGAKRTQKMFDSTAPLALSKYGAAIASMITPRTQRWHGLRHRDPDINKRQDVTEYYDEVTDILFSARYAPTANFDNQTNECYLQDGMFGNMALYTDDLLGQGMRYRSIHLSEIYFAENFQGIVDMTHRPFKYTARQAVQAFQRDGMLPECVMKAYSKDPMQEFSFLHCAYPNEDYGNRYLSEKYKSWRFNSYYVCMDEWKIVRESGYKRYPYAISRNLTLPGEVYGRGPASLVLPDIKQLNEFEKTMLKQGQLAVDPPILLLEDGALTGFNMSPGAMIYGGLDTDGTDMAKPFLTNAKLSVGFDMLEAKRKVINDAFLVTLFQILVDTPQMTAYEAMLRAQEKGQLLAPTGSRKQSEFLGTIIPRELEILEAAGELPEPPPILRGDDGLLYDVEYVSPLNLAQMAEEGIAISNTLQVVPSIEAVDPGATKAVFGGKGSSLIRQLAKINGMKMSLLNSEDDEKAVREADAQANAVREMVSAAPLAGKAAKDFAQSQALAAAAPTQIAPVTLPQ